MPCIAFTASPWDPGRRKRTLEVEYCAAIPTVDGDGQADGGAIVHAVFRVHCTHLAPQQHSSLMPALPSLVAGIVASWCQLASMKDSAFPMAGTGLIKDST